MSSVRVCAICKRYFDTAVKEECCGLSFTLPVSELFMRSAIIQQDKDDFKKIHGYYPDFAPKKYYYLSKRTKREVIQRDGNRCTECGSNQGLQVHHKVHRKDGGSNDKENLTTLCDMCHAEEHRGEPIYNFMVRNLFTAIDL